MAPFRFKRHNQKWCAVTGKGYCPKMARKCCIFPKYKRFALKLACRAVPTQTARIKGHVLPCRAVPPDSCNPPDSCIPQRMATVSSSGVISEKIFHRRGVRFPESQPTSKPYKNEVSRQSRHHQNGCFSVGIGQRGFNICKNGAGAWYGLVGHFWANYGDFGAK